LIVRLLTYNIQHGGRGREHAIAAMIRAAEPDLVLLQEARFPDQVNRIADLAGLDLEDPLVRLALRLQLAALVGPTSDART